jgi:hypothetical protein
MRGAYKSITTSQQTRSASRALALAAGVVLVGLLSTTSAFAFGEAAPGVRTGQNAQNAKQRAPIELRSTGIAHVELPLGFRARFDATATRNLYHSEDLAEAFNTGGPQLRYQRSLESRISLSRALARNVEFEIAWGARSPIENVDLLNFQRQTVGALIRFVR